ncbi:uncharacterized protein BDV14DRAFT_202527 [Aspergillus stella-maris]|uniref:uncharacterized protein n=1 Tax=Aspergillus stella-maris TaxID=1810926 RepID=UPI003CCDFD34
MEWVEQWGLGGMASLTEEQKQQNIACLDGYVIQDDFDSIYLRLHPGLQPRFCRNLAETFLNKAIVDILFRHPFWYVDSEVPSKGANDHLSWDEISPLGETLEKLHARFQTVGNGYSQVWRSITVRLCNSTAFGQTKDFTFGKAIQNHRDGKCSAIAADLLSNEIFWSLPKDTDMPEVQLDQLYELLRRVSQAPVDMQAQIPVLGFGIALVFHAQNGVPRLEGHRVLLMTKPYVWRTVNDPEHEKEVELVHEVEVIIEEDKREDLEAFDKVHFAKKTEE